MLRIKSVKLLNSLPSSPKEGEQALIEDTHELYEVKNGKWQKCGDTKVSMSLYDINKQAVASLPPIDEEMIKEKEKLIADFLSEVHDDYYMLLCRDLNYYTMFAIQPLDKVLPDAEKEIIACIKDLGTPLSIERDPEAKLIEIWFKCIDGTFVAYLFPYGKGVVKCQ